MQTDFSWNDPYTDTGASNVTDGSLDYYDFHWGGSAELQLEEERPRHSAACLPVEEPVGRLPNPDAPGYEIITE